MAPIQRGKHAELDTSEIHASIHIFAQFPEQNRDFSVKTAIKLQKSANAIALMARKLSKDPKVSLMILGNNEWLKWQFILFQFLSPFAVNALAAGIETEGGKPDDITVLLATVSLW